MPIEVHSNQKQKYFVLCLLIALFGNGLCLRQNFQTSRDRLAFRRTDKDFHETKGIQANRINTDIRNFENAIISRRSDIREIEERNVRNYAIDRASRNTNNEAKTYRSAGSKSGSRNINRLIQTEPRQAEHNREREISHRFYNIRRNIRTNERSSRDNENRKEISRNFINSRLQSTGLETPRRISTRRDNRLETYSRNRSIMISSQFRENHNRKALHDDRSNDIIRSTRLTRREKENVRMNNRRLDSYSSLTQRTTRIENDPSSNRNRRLVGVLRSDALGNRRLENSIQNRENIRSLQQTDGSTHSNRRIRDLSLQNRRNIKNENFISTRNNNVKFEQRSERYENSRIRVTRSLDNLHTTERSVQRQNNRLLFSSNIRLKNSIERRARESQRTGPMNRWAESIRENINVDRRLDNSRLDANRRSIVRSNTRVENTAPILKTERRLNNNRLFYRNSNKAQSESRAQKNLDDSTNGNRRETNLHSERRNENGRETTVRRERRSETINGRNLDSQKDRRLEEKRNSIVRSRDLNRKIKEAISSQIGEHRRLSVRIKDASLNRRFDKLARAPVSHISEIRDTNILQLPSYGEFQKSTIMESDSFGCSAAGVLLFLVSYMFVGQKPGPHTVFNQISSLLTA